MTERDLAIFRAGLRHAADMALISALAIEMREDARDVRQRAAIEALRGLADGLKADGTARSATDADTDREQGIRGGEA